ncbi:MAG: ABC transporter ATP-binding protein [Spirochaetales bacterium]
MQSESAGEHASAGGNVPRPVLQVSGLSLEIPSESGPLRPVRDLSISVQPGELHGLVGESGSGKSLTCRAILRLGPWGIRLSGGSIVVDGVDISTLHGRALHRYRGGTVGMIFQEPGAHLSPSIRVGTQVAETLRLHTACSWRTARERAREIADRVGLKPAESILRRFPHELSGGMAQRVAIAAAVICRPKLLVADEPTTALDPTVQRSVLELIDELRRDMKLAVLLVSHDLALVERYADSVSVLYAGTVVEQASRETLFTRPRHPYTQALLRSSPSVSIGSDTSGKPRLAIPGAPPALRAIPSGCPFHPRCPAAVERCTEEQPALLQYEVDSRAACHVAAVRAGLEQAGDL